MTKGDDDPRELLRFCNVDWVQAAHLSSCLVRRYAQALAPTPMAYMYCVILACHRDWRFVLVDLEAIR